MFYILKLRSFLHHTLYIRIIDVYIYIVDRYINVAWSILA